MARYYYTDPLKLAWMLKHHDLKLEEFYEEVIEIIGNNVEESNPNGKCYIHPDCHEMLKPQVGDVITDSNKRTYGKMIGKKTISCPERHNGKDFYVLNDDIKIIQRDGKAWFSPEVEGN